MVTCTVDSINKVMRTENSDLCVFLSRSSGRATVQDVQIKTECCDRLKTEQKWNWNEVKHICIQIG